MGTDSGSSEVANAELVAGECFRPGSSLSSTTRVTSSSVAGWTVFLGRPLRFLGTVSVSTSAASAALASVAPALEPRLAGLRPRGLGVLERGVLLGLPGVSDLRGRPRRLTGEAASASFSGTVVVRVMCCTVGEFSLSVPGSASTVTLMRHGLAPWARPVFMTIDLAGDRKSSSAMDGLLFCLLGEVDASGCLAARDDLRLPRAMLSLTEALSGSGDESGQLRSKSKS
ncbi:hypothetical protein BDV95DRAFT_583065 [Massariosphaeria phaeospora]|uniref:Uncharacterized protein n=1 Tax=Massariosphaeria phaeospora TaxID=100035 RepID=A0A7C8I1M2_9PLEO|nr:hypothetical protein BDV95DRAFT_583065 [Massariosphaeria phaeospora]